MSLSFTISHSPSQLHRPSYNFPSHGSRVDTFPSFLIYWSHPSIFFCNSFVSRSCLCSRVSFVVHFSRLLPRYLSLSLSVPLALSLSSPLSPHSLSLSVPLFFVCFCELLKSVFCFSFSLYVRPQLCPSSPPSSSPPSSPPSFPPSPRCLFSSLFMFMLLSSLPLIFFLRSLHSIAFSFCS